MHVIVVGCGRVGSWLAKSLSLEGHDVVVVAEDPDSFRRLGTTFNGVTIRGLGFDEDVLRQAGVEHADALAAVTNRDNDNLMVAEVAQRVFGIKRVVARAYDPARERTYVLLNVDSVCGTRLVTNEVLEKLGSEHGHHLMSMDDVELVRFRAGSSVDRLSVQAVQDRYGLRVCAVTRDGSSFVPGPDTVLRAGDTVSGAMEAASFAGVIGLVEGRSCT
jgi:trk system potassium uptake protein